MSHCGVWVWAAGALSLCAGVVAGPISSMTFGEAVAKSKEEGGWLLVAPFSPECMYCEMSLSETLSSTTMKRWLEEGVTVIRVNIRSDMDAARALRVGQMPAYIVYKDGEEFDRFGKRSLKMEDVETWMAEVRAGTSRHRKLLEEARHRGEGRVDAERRYRLAEELVVAGEYELAREEYVWLWKNMGKHSQGQVGVRGSFMAAKMRELAILDRESRVAFVGLRDEAERSMQAMQGDRASSRAMDDWMTLNNVVEDDDRTLVWFDRMKETPDGRAMLARYSYKFDGLLQQRGRWADLAMVYPQPLGELRRRQEIRDTHPGKGHQMIDPVTGEPISMVDRMFREQCADVYVAYLAAGLDEDAGKIAGLARELDASPKMIVALVEKALEIGQERAAHLEMLEDARKGGADVGELARRVDEAIKRRS